MGYVAPEATAVETALTKAPHSLSVQVLGLEKKSESKSEDRLAHKSFTNSSYAIGSEILRAGSS